METYWAKWNSDLFSKYIFDDFFKWRKKYKNLFAGQISSEAVMQWSLRKPGKFGKSENWK